jgi:hypothetical protein
VTKARAAKDESWKSLPIDAQIDMARPMEKYETVDAVIEFFEDQSNYLHPHYGENAVAQDEDWVKQVHSNFFYEGREIETFLDSQQESVSKFFILGSMREIGSWLPVLWERVKSGKLILYWSQGLFCDVDSINKIPNSQEILKDKVLQEDQATKNYFKALDKWNELESYEQVKVAAPAKPTSDWHIIKNAKIQAFTKLQNHQQVLLQLETPPWLSAQNDQSPSSQVLSVDAFWNMQSLLRSYKDLYMPHQQHGYLSFQNKKSLDDELSVREDIKKGIFSYFSKVDE